MAFLYCLDPLDADGVDELFAAEAEKAARLAPVYLLNAGALDRGDADRALHRVPVAHEPQRLVYRGWMWSPDRYAALHQGLLSRRYRLVNDPEQYRAAHHLPDTLRHLGSHTSQTVVIPLADGAMPDWPAIHRALEPLGDEPVLVKDFVKSQKHYWHEACFIPCASDEAVVRRVATRFLDLQGPDLQGGLVFRRYHELEPTGPAGPGAFPTVREYRLFILDGRVIASGAYWHEAPRGEPVPVPVDWLQPIIDRFPSRFWSVDVARTRSGEWIIVEVGDGQVSGIPDTIDARELLSALAADADKEEA